MSKDRQRPIDMVRWMWYLLALTQQALAGGQIFAQGPKRMVIRPLSGAMSSQEYLSRRYGFDRKFLRAIPAVAGSGSLYVAHPLAVPVIRASCHLSPADSVILSFVAAPDLRHMRNLSSAPSSHRMEHPNFPTK